MVVPVAAKRGNHCSRIHHERIVSARCQAADLRNLTGVKTDFVRLPEVKMKVESITFKDENNNDQEFYVVEQTRVNGINYLLVADTPEGDAEALILKEISEESAAEAEYVPVEDHAQLEALMKLFTELLEDDVEIQL